MASNSQETMAGDPFPSVSIEGCAVVTGANGLVGSRLVESLVERGVQVRAFSRTPLPALPPGVEGVLGDLRRPETLDAAVRDATVVFHCAAKFGAAGTTEEELFATNDAGTRELVARAGAGGAKRFVHVSTVAVYGEGDLLGVTEDRAPRPVSSYARSKLAAEDAVRESGAGMEWVVLRPTTIYGPREKRFLHSFGHMVWEGRVPLVGEGETIFDLVHVDDVCQALLLAATRPAAHGGTYNVADGARRTLLATLRVFAAALGTELRTLPAKECSGLDPGLLKTLSEHRHFSIERARNDLGFAPSVPLERGLAEALVEARRAL